MVRRPREAWLRGQEGRDHEVKGDIVGKLRSAVNY